MMFRHSLGRAALAIAMALGISSVSAFAQTKVWDSTTDLNRAPADAKEVPLGWSNKGTLGVNLSLMSSQDVVGQPDGASQTYGLNGKYSLIRKGQSDEWRNEVTYTGSTTKTPTVPRFVKSSDELKLATIYLYSLESYPKIGPYARAEAAAPVFKGEDVRSEPKTYSIQELESATPRTQVDSSIRLTDGFKPLATKEAVGFFYKPVTEEKIKIETRLGLAALQINARGQFAVKGTNTAGEIQVTELDNVTQAGLEAGLAVKGKFDDRTGYELTAESMTPFVNNKADGDDRSALRLTNIDLAAKLSSKMTDWASFGYDYKLKIQPQLVDRAQQIHMFVVTLNYPGLAE